MQNNRLLRRTLEGHDDPLPELVSVAEMTKRTQRHKAETDMGQWLAIKGCLDAPLPGGLQNEATQSSALFRQEVA